MLAPNVRVRYHERRRSKLRLRLPGRIVARRGFMTSIADNRPERPSVSPGRFVLERLLSSPVRAGIGIAATAAAYYLGGAVVYTRQARSALVGIAEADMTRLGIRSASEPYAALLARTVRERHGATGGLSETGATGPSGNRYGDAAGHACIGVDGPSSRVLTLETGSTDRRGNMRAFALKALETLGEELASPR